MAPSAAPLTLIKKGKNALLKKTAPTPIATTAIPPMPPLDHERLAYQTDSSSAVGVHFVAASDNVHCLDP